MINLKSTTIFLSVNVLNGLDILKLELNSVSGFKDDIFCYKLATLHRNTFFRLFLNFSNIDAASDDHVKEIPV